MRSMIVVLGLWICTSGALNESHSYSSEETGEVVGHVAFGEGFYDVRLLSVEKCEAYHIGAECWTYCYESRADEVK